MANKTHIEGYWDRMRIIAGNSNAQSFGVVNGFNSGLGTTFETIWEEGTVYEFPTVASQMTVSSDNVNDTSGGTGTTQVIIGYLDDQRLPATEILIMNGTTPVTTVATNIFRVNTMTGMDAGSNASNVGNIYIGTGTVTAGKPAVVVNLMQADIGEARSGFFSIPANVTYHPLDYVITSEKDKPIEIKFVFFNVFGNQEKIEDFKGVFNSGLSTFNLFGFGASTGIDIRIDAKIGAGSTQAGFFHTFFTSEK